MSAPAATTVAIIEDDADIRGMLTQVLELEGHQVRAFASAESALVQLRAGMRPALLLLDMTMPGMSGWTFLREQRNDPALAHLPVVAISGDGRLRSGEETIDAALFIKKPIDLDHLLEVVARFARSA